MASRCKASSRSISSAWRPRTSQRAAASMFVPVYFRWLELRADFLVAAPKRASAESGSASPCGSAGLKTERAAIRRLLCKKGLMPPLVTANRGGSVRKGLACLGCRPTLLAWIGVRNVGVAFQDVLGDFDLLPHQGNDIAMHADQAAQNPR